MTKDIIDFEGEKDQKDQVAINAAARDWAGLHAELIRVMTASDQSDITITSATLRALLDTLMARGESLFDAKKRVRQHLSAFIK